MTAAAGELRGYIYRYRIGLIEYGVCLFGRVGGSMGMGNIMIVRGKTL